MLFWWHKLRMADLESKAFSCNLSEMYVDLAREKEKIARLDNEKDSNWFAWRNLQLPLITLHWLITSSANMIKYSINSLSYFFFMHRIKKKNSQISERIQWIHSSFYSILFTKHSNFIAINELKYMQLLMPMEERESYNMQRPNK